MADRNLSFRIGAKDDASSVFSKLAAVAKRDLGAVEGAADDVGSAGKRMADALKAVADEIEEELEDTERAAERLAAALGPEFMSKVNQSDLDPFIQQLRAAGLSVDDIEQEADELAAALKRLDDVHGRVGSGVKDSFDDVDVAVRGTADSMDRTQSVFANFAGNAIQDVPGIAGSFGALNVAAGQFAEYATEGGIAFSSMVKALGPIGIATVAIGAINSSLEETAKIKAFRADQVDEWAGAIREGKKALDAMLDSFREAGKVELAINAGDLAAVADEFDDNLLAVTGFDGGVKDLTESLNTLGLSVGDFGRLTEGSTGQIETWRQAQIDAGADVDAVNQVVAGAVAAQEQLAAATDSAAISQRVFGESAEQAAARAERTAEILASFADDEEAAADAAGQLAGALDSAADAVSRLHGETLTALEADVAYQEALDSLTASLAENGSTLDANTEQGRANIDAAVDAASTITDLIGVRLRETGSVEEARAAGELYVANLREQLRQAGLTEAEVEGYIDTLNLTPTDITTLIETAGHELAISNTQAFQDALDRLPESQRSEIEALIDQGHFVEAERRLNELARPRTVQYVARAPRGTGGTQIAVEAEVRATGGPVKKGQPYIVGDRHGMQHAELFVPDEDGTILPSVPSTAGASLPGRAVPQVVIQGPLVNVDARGATSEAVERLRLQFPGEAERAARAIQRALGN